MASKVDVTKEIIFASSDPNTSRQISALEKVGELKKIAPRLYTSNTVDSVENIIKRNIIDILVWRYPMLLSVIGVLRKCVPHQVAIFS